MGRLFGTDGVRGTYGETLTDDLARSLGAAAARVLGAEHDSPRILIGRDTRASGPALERALAAGIAVAGAEALSVGVMPSAGVAHLVRATGAAAGAVISASHNPARDNGIKFFGHDGMKLADAIEDQIEEELAPVKIADGEVAELEDADERYEDFLLEGEPSLAGLRVVVDCANGAASLVAPEVYRRAGADVSVLFADPDGTNINDGCGSTHPEHLQRMLREHGAHLGIAHDGDADRFIAVDEHGELVDGDQILGICAIDARARGRLPADAVVTTVMANLGFRRAMEREHIRVVETKVGDRNVLAAMLEQGIVMGGEQSGHIMFLDRHTTGDGILTALRLLEVIVRSGRGLHDLAKAVPRFPQVLLNVRVKDRDGLPEAQPIWDEVRLVAGELDEDGRVLVRASGTEPVVRVMVEATSADLARAAAERVAGVIERTLA